MNIENLRKALSAAKDTLANAKRQSANAQMNATSETEQWKASVAYWQGEIERLANLISEPTE